MATKTILQQAPFLSSWAARPFFGERRRRREGRGNRYLSRRACPSCGYMELYLEPKELKQNISW